ncbi:5-formyltetrahydrofolate cyclo-ligase [Sphingomonas jatrophae]|uniref:5-formyltetrahydrofolate cyclo-ligase n=1 Tax=Sphingomonas jatrophae TaxID=1166337 RepID=A0A1I6L9R4_9SPHN|nr:5-formyltetrahydrofolate cyclo-ligase [Sphingomonas jatrophae]SFS00215.1 5-formyltetrahydrofolate cyclo-ligase [Sphingomonas jatrophae]
MTERTAAEAKAALRVELRNRRQAFVIDLAQKATLLVDTLQLAEHAAPLIGQARIVAAYLSTPFEPDPMPILLRALDRGAGLALPRVTGPDAPMTFHEWLPGDPLEEGPFRIDQPLATAERVTPDLILAPLVGFDARLNRLGQGAGYYDRAFAAAPDARRIGIAWSAQQADAIPADAHDVPLHAVVTERGVIQ